MSKRSKSAFRALRETVQTMTNEKVNPFDRSIRTEDLREAFRMHEFRLNMCEKHTRIESMIFWHKTGCVEVALLPDGRTAIVIWHDEFTGSKNFGASIVGSDYGVAYFRSAEAAKKYIASMAFTEPLDEGVGWALWKSPNGERAAWVSASGTGMHVDTNQKSKFSGHYASCPEAREAAAKYVRGEE